MLVSAHGTAYEREAAYLSTHALWPRVLHKPFHVKFVLSEQARELRLDWEVDLLQELIRLR